MKSTVAVIKTSPETVIADCGRLLRMAAYEETLARERVTSLDISICWDVWYPAASTTPWQLEGVIRALLADGYRKESLVLVQSRASADSVTGELNNGHLTVAERLGLRFTHTYEPPVKWINYQPQAEMLVLGKMIAEEGFYIPDFFQGANIIYLPTVKTHLLTGFAGAVESALDGLAPRGRPAGDAVHEAMVDLLAIQKEIHSGIFAVMDGTFCGDGPGPRALVPYEKGYLLAGADLVAIDAVAAHMMGFDPMKIKYIRLAHERGLGCGLYDDIEVIGEDISEVNFHFCGPGKLGAEGMAGAGCRTKPLLMGWQTWPEPLARLVLNSYWYPFIGRRRVDAMAETKWGQLMQSYLPPVAALEKQGRSRGSLVAALAAAGLLGLGALARVVRMAEDR